MAFSACLAQVKKESAQINMNSNEVLTNFALKHVFLS